MGIENNDKRRSIKGPGRPRYSDKFSGKCDVRLTKKENDMLDYLSELNGATRSMIMRKALRDFYKFNTNNEA